MVIESQKMLLDPEFLNSMHEMASKLRFDPALPLPIRKAMLDLEIAVGKCEVEILKARAAQ